MAMAAVASAGSAGSVTGSATRSVLDGGRGRVNASKTEETELLVESIDRHYCVEIEWAVRGQYRKLRIGRWPYGIVRTAFGCSKPSRQQRKYKSKVIYTIAGL